MNRFAAVALVLVSSLALAQEIGTEIPPDQANNPPPPATPPPTYDNPYAPPPAPPPPPPEVKPAVVEQKVPGPRKGAFGLRANLGGSAAGIGSPTVGFAVLATDSVGVNFDLGVGLGDTGAFGFGVGLGIDVRLGSASKPIRPLFSIGAGFGKTISTASDDLLLDFTVGGGAEYYFSDYFAVNGKALIDVPINLASRGGGVSVVTLTPGIGGTFYF